MNINQLVATNFLNLPAISLIAFIFLLLILLIILKYLFFIVRKLDKTENRVVDEIKSSVQSKFIETSIETEDLMNLAVEVWRVGQRLSKIEGVTENQRKALDTSLQRMEKFLERHDLEIRDYTGQKYNTGLSALEVISVDKDKKAKEEIVKETVEPAILLKGQIIKKAKVILLTNS